MGSSIRRIHWFPRQYSIRPSVALKMISPTVGFITASRWADVSLGRRSPFEVCVTSSLAEGWGGLPVVFIATPDPATAPVPLLLSMSTPHGSRQEVPSK
jgi:hypothetical protein